MLREKINESSNISLNFDSIRNEIKMNLTNSYSPKNNRFVTFLSLLCIIIVPLIILLLIIHLVIVVGNMNVRYSEGNKNKQEEYIASFTQNDLLELDNLYGDICWYMDEKRQYAEFKIFNSDFGAYYNLEYLKGELKEFPSNIELEHNYKDCEDFYRNVFEIKVDVAEYDMDIEYKNKLTEKQEIILVTCKLKGESQLLLNFKYRNEKIIINDVIIRYNYYLDKDSYKYKFNDTLHLEISFVYNDNEYKLYGNKEILDK